MLRPSPGRITEYFGPRPKPTPTSPPLHYGLDFGWGEGDNVTAAASGTVIDTADADSYGNRIRIDHGNGLQTWYCHLSQFLVKPGQFVTAGQRIGVQGSTGNVTAKHLHFEVRLNGVAVDPLPYLTGTASGGQPVPVPAPIPEEDDDMPTMYIDTNGGSMLAWSDHWVNLNQWQAEWAINLFKVVRVKDPAEYKSVQDWCEYYRQFRTGQETLNESPAGSLALTAADKAELAGLMVDALLERVAAAR